MKIDEKDIDLIEKYFDDTLNTWEKSVFDKKLSENGEFAELVKLRSTLPKIWKDTAQYQSAKSEIQEAVKEHKESKSITLKRIYYAVAAGILFLVGTFVIFFLVNSDKFSDQAGENIRVKQDSLSIKQQIKPPFKAQKKIFKDIKSENLQLISPVDGMVFHSIDTIIFKWANENDTTTHLLLISDYDNKTVEIIAVKPGLEMITVNARGLKPGEYYWILSDHRIKRYFSVIK
jgi:hypothetical protein